MRKHIKTIVTSFTLIAIALTTMAFINVDNKKIKLKGTQWRNVKEMQALDAGRVTFAQIIHFTTKKDAVITIKHSESAYNRPYMNPDGTVDRVEASSSENSENVTYKVSGKTIIITHDDGSKSEFIYHKDYLQPKGIENPEHFFTRYTP